MTEKPLPTAQRMIGEAITVALDPSSTEFALRRGELALAIARELREGLRPAAPPRSLLWDRNDPQWAAQLAGRKLRERDVPAADEVAEAGREADPVVAMAQRAEAAAGVGLEETQQITQVPWRVGDVSVCRFCGTPVFLCLVRTEQRTAAEDGSEQRWLHKYTQAAVCASPSLFEPGDDQANMVHTWATPRTVLKHL